MQNDLRPNQHTETWDKLTSPSQKEHAEVNDYFLWGVFVGERELQYTTSKTSCVAGF